MVLPGTFFHWTGTSVMRRPSRRARARSSTSKAKRSMAHQVEEESGRRGPEGLEPALGVLQPEPGAGGHQTVEEPAHHRPHGVGAVDHGVDQGPRADGRLAGPEGLEQRRHGPRVDGHVGVHVGHEGRPGQGHPGADGRPLAPVGRQGDDPVVREVGQQLPGGVGRPVGAAVVDDHHLGRFDVDRPVGHGGGEALHAGGQPGGLVEGRDEDGEPGCHGQVPTLRGRRRSGAGRSPPPVGPVGPGA